MSNIERFIKEISPGDFYDYNPDTNLPKVVLFDDDEEEIKPFVNILGTRGFRVRGYAIRYIPGTNTGINNTVSYILEKISGSDVAILDYGLGLIDVRNIIERVPENVRTFVLCGAALNASDYNEFAKHHGVKVFDKKRIDLEKFTNELLGNK